MPLEKSVDVDDDDDSLKINRDEEGARTSLYDVRR